MCQTALPSAEMRLPPRPPPPPRALLALTLGREPDVLTAPFLNDFTEGDAGGTDTGNA